MGCFCKNVKCDQLCDFAGLAQLWGDHLTLTVSTGAKSAAGI